MTLPKRMAAAILRQLRQPLVVDEVDLPDGLGVGQVLVKVAFSGVCGSQLGEIDGAKGHDPYLPHLLGHEGSGHVVATGAGVKRVKEGDAVVLHWRKARGIEAEPPAYRWQGEKLNAGWVTTFNEYAIVAENRVTPIPPGADLKIAALFGCAVTTGFGVVIKNARLTIGESVVVYGAGGIGLNIIQAASMVSAFPIIAVDLHDAKLSLARDMGATHVINARTVDAQRELDAITSGKGVDVFIDNTGVPAVIELGYRLTKPEGRLVLVGVPKSGQTASIFTLPIHFGKRLVGSHGGDAVPDEDIPRYLQLFEATRNPLGKLITETVPLAKINDAISRVRSGAIAGRCMISLGR